MVIVPASGNTLAEVAAGLGGNLIARAAAVTLKEGRRLIICHREMPPSSIDVNNYKTLSDAGVILASPNPGFYLNPQPSAKSSTSSPASCSTWSASSTTSTCGGIPTNQERHTASSTASSSPLHHPESTLERPRRPSVILSERSESKDLGSKRAASKQRLDYP